MYDKWKNKYPQSKNKEHFFDMPMDIKSPKELPFYVPHVVNYLNSKVNKNEIYIKKSVKFVKRKFFNSNLEFIKVNN